MREVIYAILAKKQLSTDLETNRNILGELALNEKEQKEHESHYNVNDYNGSIPLKEHYSPDELKRYSKKIRDAVDKTNEEKKKHIKHYKFHDYE